MSEFNKKIAVIIPCYNESIVIADVVARFKLTLPTASIYVYDNASKDNTKEVALNAGAIVRSEPRPGKGNVVRRMFSDIDADIYVMADGDGTYEIEKTPVLIDKLVTDHLDMVIGARVEKTKDDEYATYRFGHRLGNRLFTGLIRKLFGKSFEDVFSGFRVFSKRFVKSFPAASRGFEIETELSVHSLELRLPTAEISTYYDKRPEGSHSKLNSYRDGFKILFRIMVLVKEVRPFFFFTMLALFLTIISLLLFTPVFIDYLHTGMVARFPTAIFAMGLMILASLSFFSGLILDSVARGKREIKRLFYLMVRD